MNFRSLPEFANKGITQCYRRWRSLRRPLGSPTGRWCLRCLVLGGARTGWRPLVAVRLRAASIDFGSAFGIGRMPHTGPIWLAVGGCGRAPCGPTAACDWDPRGLGVVTHCHGRLANPAASGWLDGPTSASDGRWRILRRRFRYDVPLSLFIQQASGCIDVSLPFVFPAHLIIYEELVLAL
jgi:hypothetical protein